MPEEPGRDRQSEVVHEHQDPDPSPERRHRRGEDADGDGGVDRVEGERVALLAVELKGQNISLFGSRAGGRSLPPADLR